MNNVIDDISEKLAIMRLTVEGAISIYEKLEANDDEASLIGDALYFLRETLVDSLKVCQEDR